MEPSRVSEAQLYDILLREEAEFRPRDNRMWEMVKIDPEKWSHRGYHGEGVESWVVGIIGKQVVWYDEFERSFTLSNYDTYGDIGDLHSPGDVSLHHIMMCLIDHVGGEQAYNR